MTLAVALGYSFCWGVGITLTKLALAEIAAPTLLMIQLSSSVLFLAIACYLKHRWVPFSWFALKQGAAGVFEPALAYMVGIFGVQMTSASNASLIGASEVILTILFAALFLGEPLTHRKLGLASLSIGGVLLLVLQGTQRDDPASWLGDMLVLLGTLFAVVYVLMSKQQMASADPLRLTLSQQWVGLLVTAGCFGVLSMLDPSYGLSATHISPLFWLLAVGSGILQYALAFLLYLIALQRLPVSQAAFYVGLIPVFGVASAVLVLGDRLTVLQGIGGVLVIASSYGAQRGNLG